VPHISKTADGLHEIEHTSSVLRLTPVSLRVTGAQDTDTKRPTAMASTAVDDRADRHSPLAQAHANRPPGSPSLVDGPCPPPGHPFAEV
jgi:hypothetical protein